MQHDDLPAPSNRAFWWVLSGCAGLAAVGLALIAQGRAMPRFTVGQEAADAAFYAWCTSGGVNPDAGDRYWALFTQHYAFVDGGVGLILISATIAVLAFALSLTADREWGPLEMRTPRRRWVFVLLNLAVLGWTWFATALSFMTELTRHYYPFCADSIAIPIGGITIIAMILVPALFFAGWGVTLTFGGLPAPLGRWDRARPIRSWLVTLIAMLLGLAVAWLTISGLPSACNVAAPAGVIALYLIASARAAIISPRREREFL